ncbi:O-methyltransferase [Ascidiimonas sp. W6]|uniref:O-methyltransferase n=1 Tax=Ascidiimonas meishanensis TaxID=3128903 RepID=UPI0030EEBAF9
MHFLSEDLENYVAKHSQDEPDLLKELERETYKKIIHPRMLSGHFQGRVLSMLSKIIYPKTILEIGTYTGYSAICLAEGLQADGTIDTIDINEELQDLQRDFFDRSGHGNQIKQHVGNALEVIPTLDKVFDLVFIDADKDNYSAYFDLVIEKMRPGGIILSDNVLWSGQVLEPKKFNDKSTHALVAYNAKLKNDNRIETVLLPIRDGLTVSRVK